ncbi:MAG: SagB/ThcOx family dehydrogenase [Desulfobacteraceae bacterium]|nr:SagB/ThcOx family dehydrogenase [Desulfobacteraceae bacterium]
MNNEELKMSRSFLKDKIRKKIDFKFTDQNQGISAPPIEKTCPEDSVLINLPGPDWKTIPKTDITEAIGSRKSHRVYLNQKLSLEELAYLLWCTQGMRGKAFHGHAYRNVPSAGCRHPLETYLAIFNVEDLDPGVYRYLPLSHQLVFEFKDEMLSEKMIIASLGQSYPGKSAVTFIWAAIPYRMEWRYGLAAHKVIALDAGHVCQNLYLACQAVDAGTCAIGAYDQDELDELLSLDGEEEFAVYLAPVGKVSNQV